jgi:hypothetical protein
LRLNASVFQRATAGQQGAFYQRGDQIVKLAAGDIALPAADLNVRRLGIAGDFRRDGGIQQLTLQAVIAAVAEARLLAQIIRQQMIEIIAAERRSPPVASTSNTPRLKRRMEISKVPPPRS